MGLQPVRTRRDEPFSLSQHAHCGSTTQVFVVDTVSPYVVLYD